MYRWAYVELIEFYKYIFTLKYTDERLQIKDTDDDLKKLPT